MQIIFIFSGEEPRSMRDYLRISSNELRKELGENFAQKKCIYAEANILYSYIIKLTEKKLAELTKDQEVMIQKVTELIKDKEKAQALIDALMNALPPEQAE